MSNVDNDVRSQHDGGPWAKACDDQVARVSAIAERVGSLETQTVERTRATIDEAARMHKETVAFFAELSASLRSLTLDAAKQTADFWRWRA